MKKKRPSQYPAPRPPKQGRRRTSTDRPDHRTLLVDTILEFLAGRSDFVGLGEIIIGLKLPRHERKFVKEILLSLEKKGKVQRRGNKYLLTGDSGLVRAVLDLTARGFGFAMIEGAEAKGKDPFISPANLNGASHGDTILVRVSVSGRGRPEARVVKIIERGISRLCGIYNVSGKKGYVTPDNERLPYTVFIPRDSGAGAANDQAVLVEITDYGTGGRPPQGKIIEILGDPMTAPVQIRMAIEQFELPRSFPAAVLQEAQQLEPLTQCDRGRKDLRKVKHVTIDGETAKDFDDAVCVEKTGSGFRLYVSIADVSHYVRTGSTIDMEAYRRGTSVYVPDLVLPMLPERLSNDLCSLVPEQDRPAFTAILEFNASGRRIGQQFSKSMIRSYKRFTYTDVRQIIYDRDPAARKSHKPLLPMLEAAKELAAILNNHRTERGSIGFNIPEPEIRLDGDRVGGIARAERNKAHQLIEEFMLAANEAVAETMDREKQPVLYRIHERPDPEKVDRFTEATSSMGLPLPGGDKSPAWFAMVVREAEHSPAEYVINNLMLRTMQQARYSPENAGHFGLAAEYYLHFTSPIRRYPDLVVHRVLQNFLAGSAKDRPKVQLLPNRTPLPDAALHLSKRERVSVDVERNVQARLGALFLHEHIGEEFDAIISGVASFGLFVELLESFISGAIPVGEMKDDYYILDTRAHQYVGERTARVYRMGDVVRVRLERVDMQAKKITFSLPGMDKENK
ncbi:MAG: ribonuclease R [Desulfobulbaceae bacterium]|nr:ribonuclease R [Desulfobulbaceae bacterium]